MPKNIHTVPSDNRWAVKKEGVNTPVSIHNTKAMAEARGASLANQLKVEHIIHGRDGKIQDKDSYGLDPCPSKDKKF